MMDWLYAVLTVFGYCLVGWVTFIVSAAVAMTNQGKADTLWWIAGLLWPIYFVCLATVGACIVVYAAFYFPVKGVGRISTASVKKLNPRFEKWR